MALKKRLSTFPGGFLKETVSKPVAGINEKLLEVNGKK